MPMFQTWSDRDAINLIAFNVQDIKAISYTNVSSFWWKKNHFFEIVWNFSMISYDTIWYLLHVIVFIENLIILSKCKYLSKSKICLIRKLHRLCMQSKFILVNLIANEKHESQYSYSLCIRTEVWHFVFSFDNLIMLIYTQFLSKWLEY